LDLGNLRFGCRKPNNDRSGFGTLVFANDILCSQEPGTNEEIKRFAQSFKVQFDMFEKVDVNGSNAHPVWVYLKAKQGGLLGKIIILRP